MITLIRHVYARPDILSRIRQEIQDTYPEDIDLSDLSALHGLKFLNACVLEALRMVPPAPAGKLSIFTDRKELQLTALHMQDLPVRAAPME